MFIKMNLVLLFFVLGSRFGAQSALIRNKRSFVLSNGAAPSNNNNNDDSFILAGPKSVGNKKETENKFIQTDRPGSDFGTSQSSYVKRTGTGTFWHLSDLHLDFYYNQNKPRDSVCPSSNGAPAINPGPYGDYRCDSPWKLVNASIHAMKEINPTPDFILWTGDDTLHTNDEDKYLGEDRVFFTIKNVTDLLLDVFPDSIIYPALGNHDWHPKNQQPVGRHWLLSEITNLWRPWLDETALSVFEDGGFYVATHPKVPNLELFVLNTNIWYSSNKLINDTYDLDPAGQFAFLRSVLRRADEDGTKVYIIGHIPPGFFEAVADTNWLYPRYNDEYVKLVKEYSDVIAGQFFGHHHTDSFRLFKQDGRAVSTAWIAPGVSPWMTTLPGVEDGANNPGIRLFEYDRVTLEPTDYVQFYLDLEKANSNGKAEWRTEYRATEAYGLSSISSSEMQDLHTSLTKADVDCETCFDNEILQKFALYNTVSYNKKHCDAECKKRHTCAISELIEKNYFACINGAVSFKANQLWLFVITAILTTRLWN